MSLLARRRYPEVTEAFDWASLWTLMDGDRSRLNIAHECVDRWIDRGTALRLQFADGRREEWSFADLARMVRPLRQLPGAPRCGPG